MPSAKKRSKQSSSSKPTTRQSARKKRNQSPDPSTDGEQSDTSRDDSKENSDEDNDKHPDKDEDSNINLKNAVLPTLANYATVGVEWTDTYLDKVLARRKIGSNNRPSQDILLEAQALQDTFERSLKMLSLAGHVSYPTLRAALFLGLSQCATTAYDTYRAYSKKNTQETAMPPRNTRPGFAPRNKAIGNVWTSLDTQQKAIFHPPFFKRLAEAVLQPDSVQSSIPATEDSLNPSDLTSYIPTFRELVNMCKVECHFERGSLGIPQSVQSEKKGRDEVGKVVKQLHALHAQFQIEFHLLVSSFTPKTKLAKALWMEEYTSCDRWAQLVKSEHHLLENFAKESTQCPRDVFKKKASTNAKPATATEQTRLRQELTSRLNQLVGKWYILFFQEKEVTYDTNLTSKKINYLTHPDQMLTFIPKVLNVICYLKITDAMLEKGPAPGNMSLGDVRLWLKEINEQHYTVVLASVPPGSVSNSTT
ncbi:uncharacterized protein MELLADRAFT_69188 [Melampsora larici-populina 98AG31]|uniref:Uncharacterized protein n=1 Tax=Melampsora larici-populina (strain 98AG31 / pathotype 3-4-7) TaxID=747676 RepID=F4S9Q2_MELLP|nr:uncharacterized protein MELLADRAFT_69188 [Melampsora larici-populina 98AG31]EGF98628.1 hypothetical protein MELLADRAFT_69188 [Melampsora larici-populina 98AG31]